VGFRGVLRALLVLGATATCVRLGVWQLSRLHEKHVLHEAQRAALAEPAIDVSRALPASMPAAGRRVHVRGRWDRSLHILLSGRTHLGAAGVSLVTPVRLPSGEAVLVERGWLPAADARIAHPERFADSTADVVGVALPPTRSARAPAWVRLESESAGVALWSARAVEADSAAARARGPLAPWVLRALPAGAKAYRPGAEPPPIAEPYEVPDEAMHLSYALQWFAFAGIIAFGSLALAVRGARTRVSGSGT
jgi:surfeit locus 1 family protein